MKKYLIIAGHGWQRDGSFDPGATGVIKKGEYKYMVENLFPHMKKFMPKDVEVIFYDKLKVSNNGNLLKLVKQYDVDEVIEFHYDAFTSNARGGHVIVHADYAPDDMDLRIRDAIEKMVGLRFTHKGHKGISGRTNLYNVNLARNNGVSYRLLELGFGTSEIDADIMVNQAEKYAELLVEAIINADIKKETKPAKNPGAVLGDEYTVKKGDTLGAIAKKYNVSVAELAKYNELSDPNLIRVGEDIEIPKAISKPVAKPKPKPVAKPKKTIDQLAQEVMLGKHGDGEDRKKSLGRQYTAVQKRVEVLAKKKPALKSNAVIAGEVRLGKWGNNPKRAVDLKAAGYNPSAIQAIVNSQKTTSSVEQMAKEVLLGKHGDGHANRQKSLGITKALYDQVRNRVNQLA